MNVNDFDVPPTIDVPADARDRIEARVLPHLADEQPSSRSRLWLAAAAVAALLAGGAVVLAAQPESRPEPDPERTLDIAKAATELDRCWAAAQQSGDSARFPDRAEWQPVLSVTGHKSTVTAVKTNGRPIFCETTKTRVTLSDPGAEPAYAPDTRTGAALVTDVGTIAGVADPSWPQVFVQVTAANKDGYAGPAQQKDGLFVFMSVMSPLGGSITVSRGQDDSRIPIPQPQPAVSVADPRYPPGDRASERGILLGQCLAKDPSVIDAASWSPGAMVAASGERLIMATNPAGTSACFQQAERTQFMAYLAPVTLPAKPTLLPVTPSVGGRPVVTGLLPAGTARLQLTFAGGGTVDADVLGGTFAALLPPEAGAPATISCKAFGREGQLLYTGPLGAS
ncbi:MAG: hypothetical protein ABW215_16995 [Kibdelosporangium sp.]